ncbi:MAG: phage tail family protein [Muricomes sp.]
MYRFIDTTERASVSEILPAEALSINGRYIENDIDGYRTLHVTGRELLESEIRDIQIGQSDGSMFQNKRNPIREITVTYRLMSKSAESFREKFNILSGILEQEEAKLVFADEPDKYFIGTKSSIGEVQGGLLNVIGNFKFHCCDPYKHSTVEKVFPASLNGDGIMEATIVNNGTTDVPISYQIEHKYENGYLGIVSQYGAMQYGYVQEPDKEVRQKSQLLLNYGKPTDYDAMASGQGITWGNYPLNGSWRTVTVLGKQWLALNAPGSGNDWHGAGKMITLPPDSNGVTGAQNFHVQGKVWFETGLSNQIGMIEMAVGDESGQKLASIRIAKYELGANNAYAIFGIGNTEMWRVFYNPTSNNVTTNDKGQIYIKKVGELFEFYFGGGKWQYRVPEMSAKKAKTVTIFLGTHGTQTNNVVTRMYWDYLFFRKDNVSYWYDIPNRYRSGSLVYIDGEGSKIYTDGVISMEDEMIGTKYFTAPPGQTKVQFFYSSYSTPPPIIEARIREAYL